MDELALFAGAGGGILGSQLLGWRTVCAVEWNAYAASVLAQRQNDGLLPPFPIWDDVQTFSGEPWRGAIDVVSGGFPCQDISAAGKGAGIGGERSSMWRHMARIVGEVRPRYVFVENSPMLTLRGLGTVLGDLAALGFDARWGVLSAASVGAPHRRERIWIAANAQCERPATGAADGARPAVPNSQRDGAQEECGRVKFESWVTGRGEILADPDRSDRYRRRGPMQVGREWREGQTANDGDAARAEWLVEPDVGRVAHGVAARVDRLTAIGNGQVPQCAAEAWRLLSGGWE